MKAKLGDVNFPSTLCEKFSSMTSILLVCTRCCMPLAILFATMCKAIAYQMAWLSINTKLEMHHIPKAIPPDEMSNIIKKLIEKREKERERDSRRAQCRACHAQVRHADSTEDD